MESHFPFSFHWKPHFPIGLGRAILGASSSAELHDIWRARYNVAITLRPAREDDGRLIQELVRGLSLRSSYHRFFYPAHELTPDILKRFTHNAPAEAMTLLAVIQRNGVETAIAMAQYVVISYPDNCDFAVVVADAWQREGLGTKLIQTLICIARAAGIDRIEGDMLAENEPMLRLMLSMGFTVRQHDDGPYLRKVSQELSAPDWKCSPLTALAAQAKHRAPACSIA